MDYCLEVGQFQLFHARQTNKMTMDILEEEAFLMLDSVNAFEAVLEASKDKKGTIRSGLEKFIQVIKDIFNKFLNKVQELFRNDEKWLSNNKQELLNKNYDKLSLKVVPFKQDVDSNKLVITIRNTETKLLGNSNVDYSKYKEREKILSDFFSMFLDETGDFVDGCKNYFRVGNAKGPVNYREFSGPTLRTKVAEMIAYCQNYKTATVSKIEKEKNEIVKLMEKIADVEMDNAKEDNNKSSAEVVAKEAFVLLENCMLSDLYPQYNDILLEAKKNKKNKVKPVKPQTSSTQTNDSNSSVQNNQQKDDKPKPSSVEVENKEKETDDNKEKDEKEKNPYKGMSNEKLAIARTLLGISQTVLAARLTVAEEKYKAYMTALVQLNRNGKTTDTEDAKVEKK